VREQPAQANLRQGLQLQKISPRFCFTLLLLLDLFSCVRGFWGEAGGGHFQLFIIKEGFYCQDLVDVTFISSKLISFFLSSMFN
jgi:hypothetical protein